MSTLRKSAALTGALATAVVAVSFVTAGSASATTVSGGWYSTSGACNQSGKNITDNPSSVYYGWSWSCNYSSTHTPHWHLVLIS
ncbi:MAG: hypothetical protein HOV67_13570 [Kribbellaceae bacterium]|nr:hypothetical protein [Kribbellaceae bacterium]